MIKKLAFVFILVLIAILVTAQFRGGFVDELSQLFKMQQRSMRARKTGVSIGGGTYPITFVGAFTSTSDPFTFETAIDTLEIYMRNDTLYFDSRIGSAYLDLSEMIVLFGAGTMNLDDVQPQTQDSASSQIGSPSNPYGKGWFASVNPTYFFQELLQHDLYIMVTSGTADEFHGRFTVFSPDSIIIDSLLLLFRTYHNDVYIDSVALMEGYRRTGVSGTVIMGDGTNIGAGDISYHGHTYIVNQTISFDWRLIIKFWVATSGVAGNGACSSAKAYCHYE